MASTEKNLSDVTLRQLENPSEVCVGIVCSEWNAEITNKLLDGARQTLLTAGVEKKNLTEIHVPGSYELPIGAKLAMSKAKLDAVICLGCVIKGETDHDVYINQAVANGLTHLGLVTGIPCIFGLLTVNDLSQAQARSGGKHGNKGIEAAATAISLIALKQEIGTKKQIGF